MDPTWAAVYESAWTAFYGGSTDRERTGLYKMWQAYDQFFGIVSPDPKVRESPHFERKTEHPAEQVHRMERIIEPCIISEYS